MTLFVTQLQDLITDNSSPTHHQLTVLEAYGVLETNCPADAQAACERGYGNGRLVVMESDYWLVQYQYESFNLNSRHKVSLKIFSPAVDLSARSQQFEQLAR
jgi:hypothetical protein